MQYIVHQVIKAKVDFFGIEKSADRELPKVEF
jgi:hypothetical protein